MHITEQIAVVDDATCLEVSARKRLYRNHLDQARQQVGRPPLEPPLLLLNPDCREIDDFGYDDIKIEEYVHHEHIKAPISV